MKNLLITLGVLAIIGCFVLVNYIKYSNYGVRAEAGIETQYENNRNILSSYTTKVLEASSVTELARDDLEKVMESALSARYGDSGSKAVMNWITENYPGQVDGKLYQKVQQIIEAGRTEFQVAQTTLLDKLRIYEEQRGYFWSGIWLKIAGYPKKDLNKFKIIVDESVSQKFESGKDAPIKLR